MRDVLLEAHLIQTLDDPKLNPVEHMATVRVLTHVAAVAFRHQAIVADQDVDEMADELAEAASAESEPLTGLTPEAVDSALELLEPYANLFDPMAPALQLHADDVLMAGQGKSWNNALPYAVSPQTERFWHRGREASDERQDVRRIVLNLVVVALYSASNNGGKTGAVTQVDGKVKGNWNWGKPHTFSPGFRPRNNVTELYIEPGGPHRNLLRTLLCNTPARWVEGDVSLPGWLDTRADHGEGEPGKGHLWESTWVSNMVATSWDHTDAVPRLTDLQRCSTLARAPGVPPRKRGSEPDSTFLQATYDAYVRLNGLGRTSGHPGIKLARENQDPMFLINTTDEAQERAGDDGALPMFSFPASGTTDEHIAQWHAENASDLLVARSGRQLDGGVIGHDIIFHRYSVSGAPDSRRGNPASPTIDYAVLSRAKADRYAIGQEWMQDAGGRAVKAVRAVKRSTSSDEDAGAVFKGLATRISLGLDDAISEWGLRHLGASAAKVDDDDVMAAMKDLYRRIDTVLHIAFDLVPPTSTPQAGRAMSIIRSKLRHQLGLGQMKTKKGTQESGHNREENKR